MSEPATQAQIDAAQSYETLFVPALFGQFAPVVAGAARIGRGQRALDVGCGTGVLAREAMVRVGAEGRVSGIDAAPGMLAVAKRNSSAIDWHQGVAESLPFDDRSFDAVVCQFALMFFADRLRALREMLRVLTAHGMLAVAVWDAIESMPAYASEAALLERSAGRAAADALRAPFALGDPSMLGRLLSDAGATSIDISTVRGHADFPSVRTMVEADLRGWLPVMGVVLDDDLIGRILREAEQALVGYAGANGRAKFSLSAHIATARRA
jgi:SAM-dependent methyltransferase